MADAHITELINHVLWVTLKKRFYSFIFIQRRREGEGEREKHQCVVAFARPPLGTQPATQACALTGKRNGDPLVRRPALNPLSHTSQGPSLTCWGNPILFSTVAAPVCISTNSALGFPFLHNLASTCLLTCLWWPFWLVWSGISLWF